MSLNNPADFPSEKEPNNSLLLTPEDESRVREEHKRSRYIYTCGDEDKKILVFGSRHSFKNDEFLEDYFNDFKPDFVMVEGSAGYANIEGLSLDEAFSRYGEAGGAVYLAKINDVPAISWDLKFPELVHEAFTKFKDDAVMGFLLGQTVEHITDSMGEEVSYRKVCEFLTRFVDLDEALISEEFLNEISQKYAGKNIEDLTLEDGELMASPIGDGETNKVNLWMIQKRDPAAIDKIWDHLGRFKRVFVVAGRSHAISWKPVFEDVLGKSEQLI